MTVDGTALRFVLLPLAGAALVTSAYPPWNLGAAAGWLLLLPLLAAVSDQPIGRAALSGAVFGLASNLGVYGWLLDVPRLHWFQFLILDLYLAIYPAAWAMLAARCASGTLPAQLGLACAWVVLDHVRAHAGFLALSWATLAQSQVGHPALLQTASVLGEPGVNFLVVLGNLAIWNLLRRRRWRAAALLAPVLVAVAMGAFALRTLAPMGAPSLRVGAVATTYPPGEQSPAGHAARFDAVIEQIRTDVLATDVLVLPESALINPQLWPERVDRLQRLVRQQGAVLVVGVAAAAKFDPPDTPGSGFPLHAGAWVVHGDLPEPLWYGKSRLLPFAEDLPLRDWIEWPTWLVPPFPQLLPGPAPVAYQVGKDIRVGIMVCWESLFAAHARALASDGAGILLMLANEAWFGRSAAAEQHQLTARLRAVETGRPVIVASNLGPALIIDAHGRVVAGEPGSADARTVRAVVTAGAGRSLYTRFGDLFVLLCLLWAAGVFWWARRGWVAVRCPTAGG